jgi:hypothetical protein
MPGVCANSRLETIPAMTISIKPKVRTRAGLSDALLSGVVAYGSPDDLRVQIDWFRGMAPAA